MQERQCKECGAAFVPKQKTHVYCSRRCRLQGNSRRQRQENPEKVRDRRRRHYQKHSEKLSEKRRRYWRENPEKVREYKHRFHQKNLEKLREKARERKRRKNQDHLTTDLLALRNILKEKVNERPGQDQ